MNKFDFSMCIGIVALTINECSNDTKQSPPTAETESMKAGGSKPVQSQVIGEPFLPDVVMFDSGSAEINEIGRMVIDNALDRIKKEMEINGEGRRIVITVTGCTDRQGTATTNIRLSLRRAVAVANTLIEAGVPADAMTVSAKGEALCYYPPTRDGVSERANRNVIFQWTWER